MARFLTREEFLAGKRLDQPRLNKPRGQTLAELTDMSELGIAKQRAREAEGVLIYVVVMGILAGVLWMCVNL